MPQESAGAALKRVLGGLLTYIILGIVLAASVAIYDAIDEKGWIPHSGNTQIIYPHHGWEIGEYVTCEATGSTSQNFMDCNEDSLNAGAVREMSVRFWGKLGKDAKVFKCQRGQEEITCHLPQ